MANLDAETGPVWTGPIARSTRRYAKTQVLYHVQQESMQSDGMPGPVLMSPTARRGCQSAVLLNHIRRHARGVVAKTVWGIATADAWKAKSPLPCPALEEATRQRYLIHHTATWAPNYSVVHLITGPM